MEEWIRNGHELEDAEHNLRFPGVVNTILLFYTEEYRLHPASHMSRLAHAMATIPHIELPLEEYRPLLFREWQEAFSMSNDVVRHVCQMVQDNASARPYYPYFASYQITLLKIRLEEDFSVLRAHREARLHPPTHEGHLEYWNKALDRVRNMIHRAHARHNRFSNSFDDPFSEHSMTRVVARC